MSAGNKVVVVETDLFLRPRIESSLAAAGYRFLFVVSEGALEEALRETPVAVLVNLASPGLPFAPVISAVRARCGADLPIVGYGPHVDAALLARAREAGCTEAVPNGLVAKDAAGVVGLHVTERS